MSSISEDISRGLILVLGVTIIIVGIFGYQYTKSDVNAMETPIGLFLRGLNTDINVNYQQIKLINTASIVFVLLGSLIVYLTIKD